MARGSIVKRGKNYSIVYTVDSKQKWKTIGPIKKEAERALNEIMREMDRGQYRELKEITFKEFAKKWLSDYAEPKVKASTFELYRIIVQTHLSPHFGKFKLTSVTAHMIEKYLAAKSKSGKLSPITIGDHLKIMKTMLKRAVIWGYLNVNPGEHVEKPRVQRKEMDFLDPDEIKLLLKNVEPSYLPFFLTAALTGMRRGELLALKWSDVNFATDQIHVRCSIVMGKFDQPKSRAAIRAIIMPPTLTKTLKKHKLSGPSSDIDLVFPNGDGGIMDPNNLINRQFLPALRRASLRRIRFHDLRHTYASLLIAQGENLKFIQQQLGHSSASVTLDRYGHLMPQVQHGAGERLEESLFGDTPLKSSISKPLAKQTDFSISQDSG